MVNTTQMTFRMTLMATQITRLAATVTHAKRLWPLAFFVVLAYAISWAWTFPFAAAGNVVKQGVGWPTNLPALLGPALAAFVVMALVSGRAGVRDLLARIARSRMPLHWWAATLSPRGQLCSLRGTVLELKCGERSSVHSWR